MTDEVTEAKETTEATTDKVQLLQLQQLVIPEIGQVFVNGNPISVFLTDATTSNGNFGSYMHSTHRIFLNKFQAARLQLQTLIHEMTHSMLIDAQAHLFLGAHNAHAILEAITECLDGPIVNDLLMDARNTEFFNRVARGEFVKE